MKVDNFAIFPSLFLVFRKSSEKKVVQTLCDTQKERVGRKLRAQNFCPSLFFVVRYGPNLGRLDVDRSAASRAAIRLSTVSRYKLVRPQKVGLFTPLISMAVFARLNMLFIWPKRGFFSA